jgi:hypothetical protein
MKPAVCCALVVLGVFVACSNSYYEGTPTPYVMPGAPGTDGGGGGGSSSSSGGEMSSEDGGLDDGTPVSLDGSAPDSSQDGTTAAGDSAADGSPSEAGVLSAIVDADAASAVCAPMACLVSTQCPAACSNGCILLFCN